MFNRFVHTLSATCIASLFTIHLSQAQDWIPRGVGVLPPTFIILSMSALGDSVIWVVASRQSALFSNPVPADHQMLVARSKDGGQTWLKNWIEECTGRISFDIDAVTGDVAWITTQNLSFSKGGRGLYQTTDGGVTWTSRLESYEGGVFLHLFNETDLLCQTNDVFATSSTGGETWILDSIPEYQNSEYNLVVSGSNMHSAVGSTLWVGTSEGNIVKHINNGAERVFIDTDLPSVAVQSIAFKDQLNGMLGYFDFDDQSFGLYRTMDGGLTWQLTPSTPETSNAYNIANIPGLPGGWIAATDFYSGGSEIFWTEDFGATWESMGEIPNAGLNCIHFNSPTSGWISSGILTRFNEATVYQWNSDFTSAIRNILSEDEISIHPNPVRDVLYYYSNNAGSHKVSITDLQGHILFSSKQDKNELNVAQLSNGIYVLSIQTDNQIKTSRFIKL